MWCMFWLIMFYYAVRLIAHIRNATDGKIEVWDSKTRKTVRVPIKDCKF
jgi:hypothetical protein